MPRTLSELLTQAIDQNASDLHVDAGLPLHLRLDGALQRISEAPLSAEEAKALCLECLNQEQVMRLEAERSIDLSFDVDSRGRCRANIFWAMSAICGAFRLIPSEIPSSEQLGIPERVMRITEKPRGLVLVTGHTGSGKSTTIAAMIERINESRSAHIITIEDPIEYIFSQKKSIINQREVGQDTPSFQQGLRDALREDPNVVLVGEMRDLDTIKNAISIAETGHLVFATIHTNTAAQSVDRMIDVFPPHQQTQIRSQLALILEGVFSQQLLPRKGGGRALALEVLFPTTGIRNTIREGKTHEIQTQMQMGQKESGMITTDQALAELVRNGTVAHDEALHRCVNEQEFASHVRPR
jgi:twitching motility protein PilT